VSLWEAKQVFLSENFGAKPPSNNILNQRKKHLQSFRKEGKEKWKRTNQRLGKAHYQQKMKKRRGEGRNK
jgi:hypothetical protein